MDAYLIAKFLHVLGAVVLFGASAGAILLMVTGQRTGNTSTIAIVAGMAVIADAALTFTAVIILPITGIWLAWLAGLPPTEGWLIVSVTLYVAVGCLWLPVVFMHKSMRDMARTAEAEGNALPGQYHRIFRTCLIFGMTAIAGMTAILWLMIARPNML